MLLPLIPRALHFGLHALHTVHKLPHLLRDWAHRPATSDPELGPEQVGPVHVLHDSDAPGDRGSTLRLGYLTGPVMDQRHD